VPDNEQHIGSSSRRLKDPEPISMGLAIFGAYVAAAGLINQITGRERDIEATRSRVRRHLHEVDQRLNLLFGFYRQVIGIYDDQGLLDIDFIPGAGRIEGDEDFVEHVYKLKADIHLAGQELERALDDLSEHIDVEAQRRAHQYSDHLIHLYNTARGSESVRQFTVSLGSLMRYISDFHDELSGYYDYRPSFADRSERLIEIISSSPYARV
jgi:hypothetical protein